MLKSSKGYTLVEVMASLSMLMIIILFLVSFEMRYFKKVHSSNKTKEYSTFIDAVEKEIRNNMPKNSRIGTKYIRGDNCNISWIRQNSINSLGYVETVGDTYCEIRFLSGREGSIIIYDKILQHGRLEKKIYYY